MASPKPYLALVAAAFLLGGCSTLSDLGDLLWPFGEEEKAEQPAEVVQIPPAPSEAQGPGMPPPPPPPAGQAQPPPSAQPQPPAPPSYPGAAPPPLGTTTFEPPGVTAGQPTGTFVGQKVQQLRTDLGRMQSAISAHNGKLQQVRGQTAQHAQGYHATVGAIQSRLQVGTTPGNPVLVQQWNEAQSLLDRVSGDMANMNSLANEVSADSAMASFLLQSVRAAYGLSGAIEEDHRQLAILEDETNRTVVLIDRLLNELSDDIRRQSNYISRERDNLGTLSLAIKNGELYGRSLANRAYSTVAAVDGRTGLATDNTGGEPAQVAQQRPLVVIRFDRKDVDYEQALYTAVSRALERRPNATFDVVAVTPNRGTPAQVALSANSARRNAQAVLRTLTEMGLPAERVNLSAMTSEDAQTNEVHLYVR